MSSFGIPTSEMPTSEMPTSEMPIFEMPTTLKPQQNNDKDVDLQTESQSTCEQSWYVISAEELKNLDMHSATSLISEKIGRKRFFNKKIGKWLYKELNTSLPGYFKNCNNVGTALFPFNRPFKIYVNRKKYYATSHSKSISTCENGCICPQTMIYTRSNEDFDELVTYFKNKYDTKTPNNRGKIFTWSSWNNNYVVSQLNIDEKSETEIFGVDEFFQTMENDIKAVELNESIARKLGATCGYNYVIYGRPGTGKTSSVKALANKLGLPIYITSLAGYIESSTINSMLNPVSDAKFKIVLVEDFDRYINGKRSKNDFVDCFGSTDNDNNVNDDNDDNDDNEVDGTSTYMSALLNALEGVHSSLGTIRIFSANFPEKVLIDEALTSRMSRFIKFMDPEANHIEQHILSVYPNGGELANELSIRFK